MPKLSGSLQMWDSYMAVPILDYAMQSIDSQDYFVKRYADGVCCGTRELIFDFLEHNSEISKLFLQCVEFPRSKNEGINSLEGLPSTRILTELEH